MKNPVIVTVPRAELLQGAGYIASFIPAAPLLLARVGLTPESIAAKLGGGWSLDRLQELAFDAIAEIESIDSDLTITIDGRVVFQLRV